MECRRITSTLKSRMSHVAPGYHDVDVNAYFVLFPRLKMVPGYQLDWLNYARGGADTQPFIYARKSNAPAFAYYQDYLVAIGEPTTAGWHRPLPHAMDFLQKIETDSTPEGYLQLIMLGLIGDKFGMYGHALYDDIRVVCTGFDSPSVDITDESVTVRLTTYGCISAEDGQTSGTLAVKEYILDKNAPGMFTERTIREFSGFPIFLFNEPLGMWCNTIF